VVAIGRAGFAVGAEEALGLVWGYGAGLDLTRRDLQTKAKDAGKPWEWGKAFDRSAPCAPLVPIAAAGHVHRGRIWLSVNGAVRQDADVSELTWSPAEVIAAISRSMRLEPGDLIYTGTPAGVGPIERGDRVEGAVEGLPAIHLTVAG
jgi:fumarylpyruvate hydrolase